MDEDAEEPSEAIKSIHMEAMVKAALGGHDLDKWQASDNGWQAQCKRCGKITWVGDHHLSGFVFSHLADVCGGGMDE